MAHRERNAEAQDAPIRRQMFGCEFTYDNINLFQCKGYYFELLLVSARPHEKFGDINYWKAQLAFRGASSAGNDMERLIERCVDIEPPDVMHPQIRDACIEMSREWDQIWGGEEDEVYDEDGEEGEYEDYDENGEYMDMDEDEDDNGNGGGNFEGIINIVGGGGGNWSYTYRSWHL